MRGGICKVKTLLQKYVNAIYTHLGNAPKVDEEEVFKAFWQNSSSKGGYKSRCKDPVKQVLIENTKTAVSKGFLSPTFSLKMRCFSEDKLRGGNEKKKEPLSGSSLGRICLPSMFCIY